MLQPVATRCTSVLSFASNSPETQASIATLTAHRFGTRDQRGRAIQLSHHQMDHRSTSWSAEVGMKDRDLYSIEEARERLGGISRNTIYELLRKDELASVILGCRRFIAADAIAKLIKTASTTSSPALDSTRSRKAAQQFLSLSLPRRRE